MNYDNLEGIAPPLVPKDEQILPDDPEFSAHCWSLAASDPDKQRVYGKPQLSKNKEWGLVWRVDFQSRDEAPLAGFIGRVMCWRTASGSEGVLIGPTLAIPPLWPEQTNDHAPV